MSSDQTILMSKGILKRVQSNTTNGNSAANFTIIVNGHQFKCPSKTVQHIKLLKQDNTVQESKAHIVKQKLNLLVFQKILRIFQGQSYQFERSWEAYHIMQVIKYLHAQKLQKSMISDMQTNFDDYDFFVVFAIANKFNCKKLKHKCILELQNLHFQQMNIHKYDLLQLDPQTFQLIIKLHEELRNKKAIRGIGIDNIHQIIDDYCEQNSTYVNKQEIMKIGSKQNTRGNVRTILKEKHDYIVSERLSLDQLDDSNKQNDNLCQENMELKELQKQGQFGQEESMQMDFLKNKISITTKDSLTRSSRIYDSKKLSFEDFGFKDNSSLVSSTGNLKSFKSYI